MIKYYYLPLMLLALPATLAQELPVPRMVILGQTGTGKSTLANVLIGEDPNCKNCTFPICTGMDSCTKDTSYATAKWLGTGQNFTVVDTPGFGDSDQDDNALIDEMTKVLKDKVKSANSLILLVNCEQERFNNALQQMIREMIALFGETFWNNVVIGVSHWSYSPDNIAKRNFSGMTEEKFMKEINAQLEDKFHINMTLQGVFIDSFSQQPYNKPDKYQQEVFKNQTQKLWDLSMDKKLFAFKTVEDVLKENQELREEIIQLNKTLKDDIADIKKQLSQQNMSISQNTEAIGLYSDAITKNTESIGESKNLIDHNADALKGLSTSVDEIKITNDLQDSSLKKQDDKNNEQDATLETQSQALNEQKQKNQAQDSELANLDAFPLGTILSWVNRPSDSVSHIEDVPDGWVICDGREIPNGVWKGTKAPNLNGEGRFLRGGALSQALAMEGHMVQDHDHIDGGHSHVDTGHTHTDSGHAHNYQHEYDYHGGCGLEGCGYSNGLMTATSTISNANIQVSRANIQSSTCNVGNMKNGNKGSETRPVNMRVVWIIKAW